VVLGELADDIAEPPEVLTVHILVEGRLVVIRLVEAETVGILLVLDDFEAPSPQFAFVGERVVAILQGGLDELLVPLRWNVEIRK
jgi:hypothetical protein